MDHESRVVKDEQSVSGYRVLYLTDEEQGVRIGIAPQVGAEIASLQYRWQGKWRELLYRACQFDPPEEGWRGRTPWLFPAVGRNFTGEQLERIKATRVDERLGSYRLKGRTLEMPCHGFVMNREWEVQDSPSEASEVSITCVTRSDDSTLTNYPFGYSLSISYALVPKGYAARAVVTADADNSEEMLFSIGNHITVVIPFASSGDAEACQVRTPGRLNMEISPQSLFAGGSTPVNYRQGVALREDPSLANKVLGGYDPGEYYVDFIDPSSFGLRVSQREILPHGAAAKTSPDHFHFVFYSNPERTFFCPEPWYGGPNSLNDQRGIVRLKPGEEFQWEMTVAVL